VQSIPRENKGAELWQTPPHDTRGPVPGAPRVARAREPTDGLGEHDVA
jgi:hypothetical protein